MPRNSVVGGLVGCDMAKRFTVAVPILLAASTSFALPRPNSHVRAGANHHLGDDSFVVKYGHNVDIHASERDRMHQHLQYVRDWLASRPATRPELEQRRAEILAHFDAYIAKHTTPKNVHVPWRTPVFVDDEGTICTVGLIEQTTNRELPQRIAKAHRYDFIEDIATAMPEVADWVASSGFTLDEIAHIQPAYSEPEVKTWRLRAKPEHEGVGGSGAEDPGPACGPEAAVAPARAAKLDALLAARDQVRALTPQFVRSAVLHEELPEEDLSDSDRENFKRASDMARVLEETWARTSSGRTSTAASSSCSSAWPAASSCRGRAATPRQPTSWLMGTVSHLSRLSAGSKRDK